MSNPVPVKPEENVESLLKKMSSEIARALPKHMTADRFTRVLLTECRKTPALLKCDQRSFLSAMMLSAQLGLEPGGALGHCYLLPYGNTCQFILGYRGMIELARRSSQIIAINAHEVYEADYFEFEYGLEDKLIHRPCLGDRGKVKLFYAIAKIVGGGYQMDVMTVEDVEKIRGRSKAGNNGPWVTDYNEMAKKTVVRRLFKYLPISIEYQAAAAQDEQADRGEQVLDVFSDSIKLDAPEVEYTNSTDSLMSKITQEEKHMVYAHVGDVKSELDSLMSKVRID